MVKESRGKLVKESRGKLVKESRGKLVKESRGKLVKESRGKLVKESRGKLAKESRGKLAKESRGKTDKESVIMLCVVVFAVLAFLVLGIILIGTMMSGDSDEPEPVSPLVKPEPVKKESSPPSILIPDRPTLPSRVEIDIGDSPFLGDENAPVTLIEFSDFQCPYCANWHFDTKGQIEEQYIKTGKVKLVYMHHPISSHSQAEPAALASECAKEQGKFWEFHDLIFENQRAIGVANYKKWASDLGLNQQQFDDCYDRKKYLADVRDDLNKGRRAGVTGTPGFFMNGILIIGAQPFTTFQKVIEAELNN